MDVEQRNIRIIFDPHVENRNSNSFQNSDSALFTY